MARGRRVVITGVGLASPLGVTPAENYDALVEGRHGIKEMPEWERFPDLRTRVAGVVTGLDLRKRWPRKRVRSMGRVARLATYATEQALAQSLGDEAPALLGSGRAGIAYGSTTGSSGAFEKYATSLFRDWKVQGLNASLYLQFMAHTCAANLAAFFSVKGRVLSTCSTCTSGSQAVGAGYEAIKYDLADIMLCGGAEEMHFSLAVTFDAMFATSAGYNERPDRTPRPFDRARDGLVVGEGAGTLVLESLEHAQARGAPILAEIIGYGTNCDGLHVTAPSEPGMRGAMQLSLSEAGLSPDDIDYVNAHGTATELGDIAETRATRAVFERAVPFSSTKSYIGHTLGACGAIEVIYCLGMLARGFLPPTRNLENVDERCGELDYIRELRRADSNIIMSNNFAFGGVNTSLILRRFEG